MRKRRRRRKLRIKLTHHTLRNSCHMCPAQQAPHHNPTPNRPAKSTPYHHPVSHCTPTTTSKRGTTHRIKHTSDPTPSTKSTAKCTGVPVSPDAMHPHFFSLASRSAEYVAEKKSGRIPIAGFTLLERMPWIRRSRNESGRVASGMARRACGGERVKMVKVIGDGILVGV